MQILTSQPQILATLLHHTSGLARLRGGRNRSPKSNKKNDDDDDDDDDHGASRAALQWTPLNGVFYTAAIFV